MFKKIARTIKSLIQKEEAKKINIELEELPKNFDSKKIQAFNELNIIVKDVKLKTRIDKYMEKYLIDSSKRKLVAILLRTKKPRIKKKIIKRVYRP